MGIRQCGRLKGDWLRHKTAGILGEIQAAVMGPSESNRRSCLLLMQRRLSLWPLPAGAGVPFQAWPLPTKCWTSPSRTVSKVQILQDTFVGNLVFESRAPVGSVEDPVEATAPTTSHGGFQELGALLWDPPSETSERFGVYFAVPFLWVCAA